MAIPAAPKGTRDFYPEEMAFQQFIFKSWRSTCERYGFESIEAPMFEHLDLYTQKSGDEIEKQLYAFQDKGGRSLALRPELTPSLARMVATKGTALKRPVRWYSIPRLFRYERMQKGRLREFFQLNMDILGIAEVTADAELIAVVIDMMRDLGFTASDFKVRISSRTLLEELFRAAGLSAESFPKLYALLDKKSKITPDAYNSELGEIVPDPQVRDRISSVFSAGSLDAIGRIVGTTQALTDLNALFGLLENYGMAEYAMFDIGIVRGLAYYTGIVFEVFDISKSMRAIAGGGRYDKLVELYGGPTTPAVGFAAGDVVLGDLLKEKGLAPAIPPRSSVFIIGFDDVGQPEIIACAQELRNAGVSCEFSLKAGGVGKQLKNANAARSPIVVFLGGDEKQAGNARIKDMSSGQESVVARSELAGALKKAIDK